MKGYEMVLIVNGIIFFAIGALSLANGWTIERHGRACEVGNATTCERQVVVGGWARRAAPALFAVGVLLVGAGATFILHRRWYRPAPPGPDEGPGYP